MDAQDDVQSTAGAKAPLTREQQLERFDRWLSGAPGDGRRQARGPRNREMRLGAGLWLHTLARAGLGRELTAWEQKCFAPIMDVLGEEEVRELGRLYREHREAGTLAVVPQAVAARSFDEPFSAEEVARQAGRIGELAAGEPNVALVNRTRLLAGEDLDTPEFTEAAAAAGYGLTLFNGAGFATAGAEEDAGTQAASAASFRARLEWDGFTCHEAVGDQYGGRDEIYWTAGCNTVGYKFTTRTLETGAVSSGREYPVNVGSDGRAFFDASFTGASGVMIITCWEADQSTAEWYTALGRALTEAVNKLELVDYTLNFVPGGTAYGYVITAMDFLSTFWEPFRNHDDQVLVRGYGFSRDDLKALYYSPDRRMALTFNARSQGMGHFTLYAKYTGDAPPGPPPEGSFNSITVGWTGLLGTTFTSNLDAACNGTSGDVYLFKGEEYLRYNLPTETAGKVKKIADGWPALVGTSFTRDINAGCWNPLSLTDVYLFKDDEYVLYNVLEEERGDVKKIFDGWPGLRDTAFTSKIDAACARPGSSPDVYLFKGDSYVRYNVQTEKHGGVKKIADGWPRLADTEFASGLHAGCNALGGFGDVYLFKGSRYVRYTV